MGDAQVNAGGQTSNTDQTIGYFSPLITNITLAGRKICTAMIRNEDCGAPTSGGFLVEIVGSNFATKTNMLNNQKLFEIVLTPPTIDGNRLGSATSMGWCGDSQTVGCIQTEFHDHNSLRLYMPAGIGENNIISIRVGNQYNAQKSYFSYDGPWINTITPREGNAGSIGNADGNVIKLQGINFGIESASGDGGNETFSTATSVSVYIGGKQCLNAVKLQTSGQPPHIECKTQRDQVGHKSVTLFAASQNVTYSASEWLCDAKGNCQGDYKGGKQLFMMQCEDNTYGLFGEWCVDCPHITDAVTSASNDVITTDGTTSDGSNGEDDLLTSGCGATTIGSDLCLKPV